MREYKEPIVYVKSQILNKIFKRIKECRRWIRSFFYLTVYGFIIRFSYKEKSMEQLLGMVLSFYIYFWAVLQATKPMIDAFSHKNQPIVKSEYHTLPFFIRS